MSDAFNRGRLIENDAERWNGIIPTFLRDIPRGIGETEQRDDRIPARGHDFGFPLDGVIPPFPPSPPAHALPM